ncbi:MAG: hypothetical protein WEC83_00975 [Patescibacteria group bacterium]
MKLAELFISTAHAQSSLTVDSFKFLDLFGAGDTTGGGFSPLLGRIIGIVLFIAALMAFGYLIVSGFQYITAGGDAAKAQIARQGIINALIGILVIVVSYTLLTYVGNILDVGGGANGF